MNNETDTTGDFPADFIWGSAAAAYQVEGAAFGEGRGLSVWDMMCRQPGRVFEGHTGATACDHYHRYREDVGLMKEIGLRAYRFSISWPRVLPEGVGAVNQKGLDFYDSLVDELLAAGVSPWATLFHWDFPYALFCRGGWLNPDSPKWFADYTQVIVDRLSDRVTHWMTLNEPQCFLGLGHQTGIHAPGLRLGRHELFRACHHALLAHGLAVRVIRSSSRRPASIGWAPVGVVACPHTDSAADIAAARDEMFSIREVNTIANPWDQTDLWNNTWLADPVVFGRYPEDGLRVFGDAVPDFTEDEMKTISEPIDFYGANIYHAASFREGPDGLPVKAARPEGFPLTAFKWPVTPESMYWGPKFLHERYGLPIVITENGLSSSDWISRDGGCHDPQRIDFLDRYLRQLGRARAEGVDVRGYFLWSIMDNFEWAEGYKERFGIVHVDFQTQQRTLKDSAYWYQQVIRDGRLPADFHPHNPRA